VDLNKVPSPGESPHAIEPLTLDYLAQEIVEAARAEGLTIRVIGGVAVRIHSPSAEHRTLRRSYGDIDMVGKLKESKKYEPILESLGFEPNRPFNTLNASSYLRFDHGAQAVHLDIFLDKLEMCHSLKLDDRLDIHDVTLSLADLLLTKLQIVHLTEKDIKDIVAVIIDHPVEDVSDDIDSVDASRIGAVCGADWGWYRTVSENLEKCRNWTDRYMDPDHHRAAGKRIDRMVHAMEETPKSMKWKLRAKVGEKVKWHELPEDPTRD